jgi:phosphoribosylanthranilate isomerase
MFRTRIKFCGITRVADAHAAADCGADAVGLVFHEPSSRHLSIAQARAIVEVLPPFVTPVALFVNASADTIRQTIQETGAQCAQLHGDEPPDLIAQLQPLPILKAIHIRREDLRQSLDTWREAIGRLHLTNLRALLLETATPLPGGTGLSNDWDAIADAQQQGWFANLPPLIAAGGLTPDNVAQVIRRLHPHAVDVSSGIESAPGLKSAGKMAAFARAVASI